MNDFFHIFFGALPIAWLFVSLGLLRLSAPSSGAAGLALALFAAVFQFKLEPFLAAQAALEGAALAAFPILWVVVSALFLYGLTVRSGGIAVIREQLSAVSEDRRIQALVLALCFGGFLEAAAGFGTAVAIPAAIMVSLGFPPMLAATSCLLANTVPVAFGVIGLPVITLAQVTGLPLSSLTWLTALQLIPFVVLLPLVLAAHVAGGVRGLKGVTGACLAAGSAFAAGQTAAAVYLGPELPAVLGSMAAFFALAVWLKFRPVKRPWRFPSDGQREARAALAPAAVFMAWLPYILILLLIGLTRLLPGLEFLDQAPFAWRQRFYSGPGGKPLVFNLITSGGTIMLVAAAAGGLAQGLSPRAIAKEYLATLRSLRGTILAVVSIVALAKVMDYSGMIKSVAAAVAAVSGPVFPLFSPALGALGTFLTGTDTSSNVLFGRLQTGTAEGLGLDPAWLAAANASGATAGKMVSPQSLAIAANAVGLPGREGELVRAMVAYCLAYSLLMGALVLLGRL